MECTTMMDSEYQSYVDQIEAHLRVLDTDTELFGVDNDIFSTGIGWQDNGIFSAFGFGTFACSRTIRNTRQSEGRRIETGSTPADTEGRHNQVDTDTEGRHKQADTGNNGRRMDRHEVELGDEGSWVLTQTLSLREELSRARKIASLNRVPPRRSSRIAGICVTGAKSQAVDNHYPANSIKVVDIPDSEVSVPTTQEQGEKIPSPPSMIPAIKSGPTQDQVENIPSNIPFHSSAGKEAATKSQGDDDQLAVINILSDSGGQKSGASDSSGSSKEQGNGDPGKVTTSRRRRRRRHEQVENIPSSGPSDNEEEVPTMSLKKTRNVEQPKYSGPALRTRGASGPGISHIPETSPVGRGRTGSRRSREAGDTPKKKKAKFDEDQPVGVSSRTRSRITDGDKSGKYVEPASRRRVTRTSQKDSMPGPEKSKAGARKRTAAQTETSSKRLKKDDEQSASSSRRQASRKSAGKQVDESSRRITRQSRESPPRSSTKVTRQEVKSKVKPKRNVPASRKESGSRQAHEDAAGSPQNMNRQARQEKRELIRKKLEEKRKQDEEMQDQQDAEERQNQQDDEERQNQPDEDEAAPKPKIPKRGSKVKGKRGE